MEQTFGEEETALPCAAAVIVAGGASVRFASDKLMADLNGIPILIRSVLAFQQCRAIQTIVLVTRRGREEDIRALCSRWQVSKLYRVVAGGETRALSSLRGVQAVPAQAELIAIHDGCRPLVSQPVILDALDTAHRLGAALPAVPVKDTIKKVQAGTVVGTPDRAALFAAQTPQCFQAGLIRRALEQAADQDITDDCMAVERAGGRVFLSPGSEKNIKITTPLDLTLARALLREEDVP